MATARIEEWINTATAFQRRGRPDVLKGFGAPGSYEPSATTTGTRTSNLETITPAGGTYNIDTPGLYENLHIEGYPKVRVDGVILRNIVATGQNPQDQTLRSLLTLNAPSGRTIVEDVTLVPDYPTVNVDGLKGYRFMARRVDVSGVVDTFLISGDDSTLEACWGHDNAHYEVDPRQSNGPSHDDGLQIQGGKNILVDGTSIEGGANAGVILTKDLAQADGPPYTRATQFVTFRKSWVGGGAVPFNFNDKGVGPFVGITVQDMHIRPARIPYPQLRAGLVPNTTSIRSDFIWDNVRWADDVPNVGGQLIGYSSGGAGS